MPDLVLDGSGKLTTAKEIITEVSEQVSPQDAVVLQLLLLKYDNRNLAALLTKSDAAFDERGSYTKEELVREIKTFDTLPAYMQKLIELYQQDKLPYPDLTLEDQISWLFYDEVLNHDNLFISNWYRFDLDSRNVLAALNFRRMVKDNVVGVSEMAFESLIISRNDVAQSVLKSSAPDFALSLQYPWLEKLLALQSNNNIIENEKTIDRMRWYLVDELSVFSYFQIETVLAFCIKLEMVERWQKLDPEIGKDYLDKLIVDLESGLELY